MSGNAPGRPSCSALTSCQMSRRCVNVLRLSLRGTCFYFGNLSDIRRERGIKSVQVRAAGVPDDLRNDNMKVLQDNTIEYDISGRRTPEQVFQSYAASGIQVDWPEGFKSGITDYINGSE